MCYRNYQNANPPHLHIIYIFYSLYDSSNILRTMLFGHYLYKYTPYSLFITQETSFLFRSASLVIIISLYRLPFLLSRIYTIYIYIPYHIAISFLYTSLPPSTIIIISTTLLYLNINHILFIYSS